MGRPPHDREKLAAQARWNLEHGLTLSPAQAAVLLSVSSKTIGRWCLLGTIADGVRTDGGHWRVPASEVLKRLAGDQGE